MNPKTKLTYNELWQNFCELSSHLQVLSKVVIAGNQSAALQFAMQTESIINKNIKKLDFSPTCAILTL